jgi:magnesium-transporting ATPase (P-type)
MISESSNNKMQENIRKMAESSLRTLCIAYKKISSTDDLESKDDKGVFAVERTGLTLLCIAGVRDIPRK